MNIQPDFEEFFRLLGENRVEYMIVGGYAVAFHGYPRFTKDIDIFFDATEENVSRLRAALVAFGFEDENLPPSIFLKPGNILTFGVEPTRIDLLNQIDGVVFSRARENAAQGKYGNTPVFFIGRDALIANKRSTLRPQDRVDAEALDGT